MGKRVGTIHAIIPDVQVTPDTPTKHLTWVGNYLEEKRPDTIICIGDFADLPSLSYHGRQLEMEGKRYKLDIEATRDAMSTLLAPLKKAKGYKPRKVLTLGNHEDRIVKFVKDNPKLKGFMGLEDLGYAKFGWEVVPFLKPIGIDGISYAHYFTSGILGRPVSSAASLLRERHSSAVMGHVQYTDIAIHKKTGHIGIFAGICYLHDEEYLTPQGNTTRRQIVFLHEVANGIADPMLVSLKYLGANYA